MQGKARDAPAKAQVGSDLVAEQLHQFSNLAQHVRFHHEWMHERVRVGKVDGNKITVKFDPKGLSKTNKAIGAAIANHIEGLVELHALEFDVVTKVNAARAEAVLGELVLAWKMGLFGNPFLSWSWIRIRGHWPPTPKPGGTSGSYYFDMDWMVSIRPS